MGGGPHGMLVLVLQVATSDCWKAAGLQDVKQVGGSWYLGQG